MENYKGNEYELIATGTKETDYFDKLGIKYYKVNITKKDEFEKLPKNLYGVIDLAGLMPARMKGYEPQKYIDVNNTGNLNILEYCRINHADRILFTQSFGDIKDYGETELVLRTDMQRNFSFASDHTIYVMSKNFAVDMIENYYQMYGLKKFIFRLPTIYLYSPIVHYYVNGISHKIAYRMLIDKTIAGEDIEVWGDETRLKDMVYIKDFCQMIYKALFVNRTEGCYNVGTGIGTSLFDQIKGIVEIFGTKDHKSRIIMRPDKDNAPQYIMDISSAREELGYRLLYDYVGMLKDFKIEMEKEKK